MTQLLGALLKQWCGEPAQALLGISLHLSEPLAGILFLRASSPLVSRKGKSHEIKYHFI